MSKTYRKSDRSQRPLARTAWIGPFIAGVVVGYFVIYATWDDDKTPAPEPPPRVAATPVAPEVAKPTLDRLLAMEPAELAGEDVAVLNLACAEGLNDGESLDVAGYCRTLDNWARLVDRETRRNFQQFHRDPGNFENSEGYFRMLVLVTVLQQDLSVRYNPERINEPDFRNPADLFIHGMIGSRNGGTCVSMPVLYAAVARRLGYPVHLVLAKAHVFCRWEDDDERLNIEAAGVGMSTYPDSHYREWPIPIEDVEMERNVYLRNLTAAEEFGMFLSARAACLEDRGRLSEAYSSFLHAYQFGNENPEYLVGLKIAIDKTLIPISIREGKYRPKRTVQDQLAELEAIEKINAINRRATQRTLGMAGIPAQPYSSFKFPGQPNENPFGGIERQPQDSFGVPFHDPLRDAQPNYFP